MRSVLILADDLSGAAESAGAIAQSTSSRVEVRLAPATGPDRAPGSDRATGSDCATGPNSRVVAIDTDSRARGVQRAGTGARPGALVYRKVDSLLRGDIAAESRALRAEGFELLAVLAVPRIGRTVRSGHVHVDGVPLADSPLADRLLGGGAHGDVGRAIGLPSEVVPVGVIRSAQLDAVVAAVLDRGAVPVFDGETQADLDAVAEFALRLDRPLAVLAAGGLARSLGPLLGLPEHPPLFRAGADRVVVVVGSGSPIARQQADALCGTAVRAVVVAPGERPRLDGSDAVITLDHRSAWDSSELDRAFELIAHEIGAIPGRTDLVLTGGETARRVLDGLGIERLWAEAALEDGVVLCTTDDGRAVVTKPGSFGGPQTLRGIVDHVKGIPT